MGAVSVAIEPSMLNTFVSTSAARSISGRTISPSNLLAGSATCFEACVIAAAFRSHELQRLQELTAATCPKRNVVSALLPLSKLLPLARSLGLTAVILRFETKESLAVSKSTCRR